MLGGYIMFEYFYTREIVNDAWNINNNERVDQNGNQICLSSEVEQALPDKMFKMFCAAEECKFVFEVELTENEKSILDLTVYNHKNNL